MSRLIFGSHYSDIFLNIWSFCIIFVWFNPYKRVHEGLFWYFSLKFAFPKHYLQKIFVLHYAVIFLHLKRFYVIINFLNPYKRMRSFYDVHLSNLLFKYICHGWYLLLIMPLKYSISIIFTTLLFFLTLINVFMRAFKDVLF